MHAWVRYINCKTWIIIKEDRRELCSKMSNIFLNSMKLNMGTNYQNGGEWLLYLQIREFSVRIGPFQRNLIRLLGLEKLSPRSNMKSLVLDGLTKLGRGFLNGLGHYFQFSDSSIGMLLGMILQVHRNYDLITEVLEATNITFCFIGPWRIETDILLTVDPTNISTTLIKTSSLTW